MPRFFTLQQAEQLLPEVESAIRDAISLKSEYQQAEADWQNFSHRVTMLGGVLVDHSKMREQRPCSDTDRTIRQFHLLPNDRHGNGSGHD